MPAKKQPKPPVETPVVVKVIRPLFCLDGKDHVIIRNEDCSIYIDSTNPRLYQRFRWIVDDDGKDYQYWDATVYYPANGHNHPSAKPRLKLVKKIKKDLGWDDDIINNLTTKEN